MPNDLELANLAVERGLLAREQLDACIAELKTTPTWTQLRQRYQLAPE